MTRSKLERTWPDIPRLLRARSMFADLGPESASSVPAFLAWKAFMVSVRAEEGDTESARCRAAVEANIRRFPLPLEAPIRKFAAALKPFRHRINRVAVAEWYLRPEELDVLTAAEITKRVDSTIRRIVEFVRRVDRTPSERLFEIGGELSNQAYNVRSAVLAHVAVLSTGNLFAVVVPAFESLAASLAIAGWARRANVTFEEAHEASIADDT